MIVADTNLVVYHVVEGDRSATAERVRSREAHWVAPPLWASEFRNALVQHVRHDRLSPVQAHGAWSVARDLVEDLPVDPAAALDAALSRGLSGYDAEFVALAERLGVPLVTDDRRVLQASPDVAVSLDAFADGDTPGGHPAGGPPDAGGR